MSDPMIVVDERGHVFWHEGDIDDVLCDENKLCNSFALSKEIDGFVGDSSAFSKLYNRTATALYRSLPRIKSDLFGPLIIGWGDDHRRSPTELRQAVAGIFRAAGLDLVVPEFKEKEAQV